MIDTTLGLSFNAVVGSDRVSGRSEATRIQGNSSAYSKLPYLYRRRWSSFVGEPTAAGGM